MAGETSRWPVLFGVQAQWFMWAWPDMHGRDLGAVREVHAGRDRSMLANVGSGRVHVRNDIDEGLELNPKPAVTLRKKALNHNP